MDKTLLIRDVAEASAQALLLPRPRRFGKTLNLSMLRYFFEKCDEDSAPLFEGTGICETGVFQQHRGQYPVIYMTFKDVKALSWEMCLKKIAHEIRDAFVPHVDMIRKTLTDPSDLDFVNRIMFTRLEQTESESALKRLSGYLHQIYEKPVVILIDEYDTPIHAGYHSGYYDETSVSCAVFSAAASRTICIFSKAC